MYVIKQRNLEQMGRGLLTRGKQEPLLGAESASPVCSCLLCACVHAYEFVFRRVFMYVQQRSDISTFALQCEEQTEGAEGGRFQEAACRQSWAFAQVWRCLAKEQRGSLALAILVVCRRTGALHA